MSARALVVAKVPVPGQAKTRLGADIGMTRAAEVAAAALLDTLAACTEAFGAERCHLALAGDLAEGVLHAEIEAALAGWTVRPQRGDGFAERLVHAHADLASAGPGPVVQVGMDTPQVTPELLLRAVAALDAGRHDAVLGPAEDGGWWVLALRDPRAAAPLRDVAMSTATTYADTRRALEATGMLVATTTTVRDVDTLPDAEAVATSAPGSRFARTWAGVRP
ncbi:TIGR04282 family arsenosugar biosynthesis glycosyltransferase [Nocardioides dongkuii]|uniref:TIGR04282 family arsenosugar biosynthesis glycosyltransferase n=1 Tax=Nocardioides dongkuii TaxID=2760089 RepID=UPI001C6FD935|nr:DUF2064 domain-containing protein [Nocardioides dongkuii]